MATLKVKTASGYNTLQTETPFSIPVQVPEVVTSISSSSTDSQVPSAKCVYDNIQRVMYEVADGSANVASTTWVTIAQTPALSAGIYVISACVTFGAGQTGSRQITLSTTSEGGTPYLIVPTLSSTSTSTILTITKLITVGDGTIIYLRARHSNGSTLTVSSKHFRYIKL